MGRVYTFCKVALVLSNRRHDFIAVTGPGQGHSAKCAWLECVVPASCAPWSSSTGAAKTLTRQEQLWLLYKVCPNSFNKVGPSSVGGDRPSWQSGLRPPKFTVWRHSVDKVCSSLLEERTHSSRTVAGLSGGMCHGLNNLGSECWVLCWFLQVAVFMLGIR